MNVKFTDIVDDDDLEDHLGFFENEELLKQNNDFEIAIPEDNPEMMRMFALIAGNGKKAASLPPLASSKPKAGHSQHQMQSSFKPPPHPLENIKIGR